MKILQFIPKAANKRRNGVEKYQRDETKKRVGQQWDSEDMKIHMEVRRRTWQEMEEAGKSLLP